jgi:tRNA(Arg) A34 adenosine deaminase TadA
MQEQFMLRAIELANNGMNSNDGGPFGCVIVKNGEIIGEGNNNVTGSNDPTAHAEIVAIRNACKNLNSFQLDDCEIYTSCEPCPMCLGAIYWARPSKVFYACTREDAASIGFDDDFIYKELNLSMEKRSISMVQILQEKGIEVFKNWMKKIDKIKY